MKKPSTTLRARWATIHWATVRALGEVGGKTSAELGAEITGADAAARKLVRDLELLGFRAGVPTIQAAANGASRGSQESPARRLVYRRR